MLEVQTADVPVRKL